MHAIPSSFLLFFFNDTATTEIYTLSLHDALPIFPRARNVFRIVAHQRTSDLCHASLSELVRLRVLRSEEHTSELQSPVHLVCRLLLEKKNNKLQVISCLYRSDFQ